MFFKNLFRRLMFSDAKSLVLLARKKVLQAEDMPPLPRFLNPRTLPDFALDVTSPRALVRTLFRGIKHLILPALALNTLYVGSNLLKPILVNGFVSRVGHLNEGQGLNTALAFALAIGLLSFLGSLCLQHYFLRSLYGVQMVTSTINRLVYKHSLMLTQKARSNTELGDVVNHMSSDTDSISEMPMAIGDMMATALVIVGSTALLFYYLGYTAFLSVGLLLILAPLSRVVARSFSVLDEELMRHRDRRVTLMSQILNGIRVVKYFAWEQSVSREVGEVRAKELHSRKRLARAEALATLSYVAISTIVLFATLALHAYRGFALTPELAFTCVAIFTILEDPFGHLSELISKVAAALVASDRICRFLAQERLPHALEKSDRALPGIEMSNVTVQFDGAGQPALRDVSLHILPGESVAVVGPVGSGKSTLIHALLRETSLKQGSISYLDLHRKLVVPRTAYVPQEAFIVNGSLKENILFGNEENDVALRAALHASCLEDDLPQLPAGLLTEIGEKGVNLSGGQKQRVSLARSVMHGPNLALLDDPLSAVDARTEEQLIERLVFGEWKGITRVVVTHRLAHLARFDKVIFLVEGAVAEAGTLNEISQRSPEFRAFFADSARAEHGASWLGKEKDAGKATEAKEPAAEVRLTEDEDRAIGAVKGGVYIDYLKALGGNTFARRSVAIPLLLASSVAASALPLLQKSWLALSANLQNGQVPNEGGWIHGLAESTRWAIPVYGFLGLATLAGVLVNRLFWLERGIAAGRDMHDSMLRSVLKAPLRFFDSTPMGRILQRFSRDVESVDIQLQWSFETTVKCLVNIGTALFLILGVLPLMVIVILPVLGFYYLLQRDYRIPAREAKRLDSISRSPRFAHFKETLQGLVVIRSFGKTDAFLDAFYDKLEMGQRMFYGHYMLNRWFSSRIPLLGAIVSSATAVGIVFYAYRGDISAGTAGLVIVYAISLWESLNWAVRIFAEVEARMTSVERLKYYASLESEQEVFLPPEANLEESWPAKGEVVFDRVQVRYAHYLPPVLKGISFRIPAGSRVGIIGRTGSGKSTLLQALYRCMEVESGEIRIDGVNIASVPLKRLRLSLAIIPQDPTLFLGTLRSNLDRYHEYSDEAVWEALRKARLQSVVEQLPGGLSAPVKENGANFSQGQRQLLCLARALLAKSRIIVMDEATASVDVQTDGMVQEVVRESCQGVTMLIIAHRLGTVADCDLILEVKEGKLHRALQLKKEEARAGEGVYN